MTNLKAFDKVRECAETLESKGLSKPRHGTDMGDHPPITPTTFVPDSLKGDESRLYEYICRHFLASVAADASFVKTTVKLRVAGH